MFNILKTFIFLKFISNRENPNDRSAKDVQHLGPATDFYKRLALECSGQQIAVDIFLLNSQYSDLATLCKYSLIFLLCSSENKINKKKNNSIQFSWNQ